MTKERLEELIKQGGWIWILDSSEQIIRDAIKEKSSCFGLQLNSKEFVKDNFLRSELGTKYAKLNNIYETKEQAEWALKTVAERTERFEPPRWEDIENGWNFYFAKGKDTYHFWVEKDCIGISKCEYLCDYWSDAHKTLFEEEATKENYEKACEIVRDLFKGEK